VTILAIPIAGLATSEAASDVDMPVCACKHVYMGQAHGVTSETRITSHEAKEIARVMAGLGTGSRVQILGRLRESACSVGELCDAVGMAQPAVSHQLRVLRDLNLVVGVRTGRQTIYGLYDPHVAVLLDEALRHIEHLRAGSPNLVPLPDDQSTNGAP
jgi:DNA-binding transcriptional ArsR family regulator